MKKLISISLLFFNIYLFSQINIKDSINKTFEKQIQEVEIKAKQKLIERKVDRLVLNVESSISATGGDALDVLNITPGIRIQNDQISMIGKSGVSVMIDDRLLQLSDDDLINFLKTIKSDAIKSIEVITNPPAKYDAEGNSGIVNIKLKKAKKNSISGNLKTSYTQAKHPLGSLGGGLNYQKNKWTITSNINYSNGSTAPYQEYTLYYPNYTWFETNNKRIFQNSLGAKFALGYQVSPKTTMDIEYLGAFSKPLIKRKNTSYITNNNSVLDSLIITPSRLEIERNTHSLNFHSVTKIDTLGTQYSIDIDYFKFQSDLDNNFSTNTYFSNNIPAPNRYISVNNLSNQNIDIYSAKIDYEMPLKWINLSFGGKISFINNDSKVSYFDTTGMNPIFDPSKSNIFNYKENTQALYISGNKKLSEKWNLQLGMRLESTQTKGYSETLRQTNKNDYIQLFPTFYLTYKATENSSWGLNYNKRIDRPTYGDLNPFRFYSSSYNYSEGNPFLQPFFTDNIDISHTYKDFYTSIYFNYLTNGFDQVTYVSKTNISQIVTPYNFYTQKTVGLMENYVFNKIKWWESNNQMTISYSKTLSKIEESVPSISSWAFTFNSNNAFILNKAKTIKAELNFNYMSPSVAGSYKISSRYYFDAGFKFSLLEKKLEVAINAIDVFKTNKYTFTQIVNGIKQNNYDYPDSQKIRLSLAWNFGKQLKSHKREQSNEEEKSRAK
ncbi:TonB-dependent receptor [Elizabethkingia argentiflava]|uniref:TonB-dependent receptor n=1 Tax=Elizabethkingia argenteiflava TaxID=2681556 RepID=A0A845PTP5_9FLAO|nr:TonB-dependent receptor [Elizabethkingia argenteiflava]NAW51609.1 TonB-dependent receptor [Elizabethkingia argenteiflava]